jgi:hypothetical protein
MSRNYLVSMAALLALVVFGAGASSALATENLREKEAGATTAVGTNFAAANVGVATLSAPPLTVTCNKSTIGGTVATAALEPALELQSVTFGGCEASGVQVIVKTKTNPAWKLKWFEAKKFNLTGISAEITVGTKTCKVENATENFKMTWKNYPFGLQLAELSASAAPLKLSGTECPTTGTETATYKFSPETITNTTEKFWLE